MKKQNWNLKKGLFLFLFLAFSVWLITGVDILFRIIIISILCLSTIVGIASYGAPSWVLPTLWLFLQLFAFRSDINYSGEYEWIKGSFSYLQNRDWGDGQNSHCDGKWDINQGYLISSNGSIYGINWHLWFSGHGPRNFETTFKDNKPAKILIDNSDTICSKTIYAIETKSIDTGGLIGLEKYYQTSWSFKLRFIIPILLCMWVFICDYFDKLHFDPESAWRKKNIQRNFKTSLKLTFYCSIPTLLYLIYFVFASNYSNLKLTLLY
jgi:hypothetical protein